jgi:hypothetical protein
MRKFFAIERIYYHQVQSTHKRQSDQEANANPRILWRGLTQSYKYNEITALEMT